MTKKMTRIKALLLAVTIIVTMTGCGNTNKKDNAPASQTTVEDQNDLKTESGQTVDIQGGSITLADIPEYSGETYAVINNNVPFFTQDELSKASTSWGEYGDLDSLGRCTACWASVGQDIMPTGDRGSIGSVKPTGWHTVKYDCVDGKYLYNRSHLVGYQLTGENANDKNLVTGTRYFNVDGMLPFENMVADYVHEDNNHVLYRVTPMFDSDDLVCKGVLMEAMSYEDNGDGVLFNVFVYNIQPGVTIDYATGESCLDGESVTKDTSNKAAASTGVEEKYVLNTNSKKFHKESCSSVSSMNPANKKEVTSTRDELISEGYDPCGSCKP